MAILNLPQKIINEAVSVYGNKYLFVYPRRSLHDDLDWIFGENKEKGYVGICSHCGSHVEYNGKFYTQRGYGALDKDYVQCPECFNTLEVRKGWYGKKRLKQRFYLQAIDVPSHDKVIIYEAIIFLDGWDDYKENHGPDDVTVYDLRSTVLTPGKSVTTRWNGRELETAAMCRDYEARGFAVSGFNTCITNTGYCLGAGKLTDSYLARLAEKLSIDDSLTISEDKLDLLIRLNEESMTELLYSMGFSTAAADRAFDPKGRRSRYMNFKTKSPKKFLRGMNDRQKAVIRSWLSKVGNKDKFKVREIEKVIKFVKAYEGVTASALDFSGFEREDRIIRDYMEACERLPYFSPVKISNYMKRHCKTEGGAIYLDYLRLALKLAESITDEEVAFPKNLREAHDEYAERVSYAANAEQAEKMKARLKKQLTCIDRYRWGGLVAVIPDNPQEIISEGQIMKNCIGNYTEDHADGETTIVFIRRETAPHEPFFDLELNLDGKDFEEMIEQCYGYNNRLSAKHPKYSGDKRKGEKEKNDSDLYVHEFLKKYIRHINYCLSKDKTNRRKTA